MLKSNDWTKPAEQYGIDRGDLAFGFGEVDRLSQKSTKLSKVLSRMYPEVTSEQLSRHILSSEFTVNGIPINKASDHEGFLALRVTLHSGDIIRIGTKERVVGVWVDENIGEEYEKPACVGSAA